MQWSHQTAVLCCEVRAGMVVSASDEVWQLLEKSRQIIESSSGEGVKPSRDDHGGVQTNGTGRDCAVPQRKYLLTGTSRAEDLCSVSPAAQTSS